MKILKFVLKELFIGLFIAFAMACFFVLTGFGLSLVVFFGTIFVITTDYEFIFFGIKFNEQTKEKKEKYKNISVLKNDEIDTFNLVLLIILISSIHFTEYCMGKFKFN